MSPDEPAGPSATARRWPVVVAWALWALAVLSLAGGAWVSLLLRQAGHGHLATVDPLLVVACVSAATVGLVLAVRRPRHPVGWMLLALGMFLAADWVAAGYGPYGLTVRPGALPAAALIGSFYPAFAIAALACMGFVLLLTPTGSLPSTRWRWRATAAVAAPVASLLVTAVAPIPAGSFQPLDSPFDFSVIDGALRITSQVALWATSLALVVAAGSLLVRFRRAHGVERQQLRWVALAAALVGLGAVVALLAQALGGTTLIGSVVTQLVVAALPVAVGAAVLRYRLYDLDRIVSRTLAYGLLTVILGAGYAGVVLTLGQLLGRDGSGLAVAGATLAVAAVFQPARRRIQEVVDRRFNRRRYDAERTIAAFSGRLRQQIDLDALTAELLAVVDQTMQPTRAALWLRPAAARPARAQDVAEPGRGASRVPV